MLSDVAFAVALTAAAAAGDAPLYTTPYFQSLGIAAGLPSSRIYKTLQDRDGYLWVGTHDGLARYDGVGFRVYRHDPKDADTLGGDIIGTLFVDRDNRVWCGTEESGLSLLDATRGKFTHYVHDEHDPASLGGNDVWAITQDASGAIWVGGYAAACCSRRVRRDSRTGRDAAIAWRIASRTPCSA
jgi:ligand-binding sensor domain-containing protein